MIFSDVLWVLRNHGRVNELESAGDINKHPTRDKVNAKSNARVGSRESIARNHVRMIDSPTAI